MAIFRRAMNAQCYLKMCVMGLAGSGKTYTAMKVAIGLHDLLRAREVRGGDSPVFMLDTEIGSDWVKRHFDQAKIPLEVAKTRAFTQLLPAIDEVQKANGILIIDSITHFWKELMETYSKKRGRKQGLQFQDWAWLKTTWGEFTDRYINSSVHIIMCGRAGWDYNFFEVEGGKKELEKTGVKMKAEAETAYEPNLLVLMERHQDISGAQVKTYRTASVLKDRGEDLDGKVFRDPTFEDFSPHVARLNLGGEQYGVDTETTSEALVGTDNTDWRYRRQQVDIKLDEIQTLMVKHHPSQGKEDKAAKYGLLEKFLGTTSWERVKSYDLDRLKDGFSRMYEELEGRPWQEPRTSSPPAEDQEETVA